MNVFGVSGLTALVVLVALVALLALAALLIARTRRLDRLHVRVDGARLGLWHALDRRAAVARTVAAVPTLLDAGRRHELRAAAHAAEEADEHGLREAAENELAGALNRAVTAGLPGDLAAELADADARTVVARRVYNDAVRDTRALRGRRLVRLLRLAGTAPYPRYFEVAEREPHPADTQPAESPPTDTPVADTSPADTPAAGEQPSDPEQVPAEPAEFVEPSPTGGARVVPVGGFPAPTGSGADRDEVDRDGADRARTDRHGTDKDGTDRDGTDAPPARTARDAARVVVRDPTGRTLLFEAVEPDDPARSFWFTPGGGVEPGETPAAAATRELAIQTGLHATPGELGEPLWTREVTFTRDGVAYVAHELFFGLRTSTCEVDGSSFTMLGRRRVAGFRWWSADDFGAATATVHPRGLPALVAAHDGGRPLTPR